MSFAARRRTARLFAVIALLLATLGGAHAAAPRIVALARCGDLLAPREYTFCVRLAAPMRGSVQVQLDGKPLGTPHALDSEQRFEFSVDRDSHKSGALRVTQGKDASNPVWLSLQSSATLAARTGEVVKNHEGISTFVDLLGIIIEEEYDSLDEARRLAKKYDATVVGAIPPLRLYQLRLATKDLTLRDATAMRLGGEESIDAVVIEESAAEDDEPPHLRERGQHELAANRFVDAVDYYQRRIPGPAKRRIVPQPVRIGVIEERVDFDAPDFIDFTRADDGRDASRLRLFARDASDPASHGSVIAGLLAARWGDGGNSGFLRGMDGHHGGFDVIVDRGSDAGVTENVAASVRLVQDGARVLNWSWGLHRTGARRSGGGDVESSVRSGIAFEGYEELLEEFFLWLRRKHPDVIVVNSAGNGGSFSGNDDYRLPSSFITEQLIVVGAHQVSARDLPVEHPDHVERRAASNIDGRVDITAAACVSASVNRAGDEGEERCGTSYATALVTGLIAAMISINPELQPEGVRELLRRSAMPIGKDLDFEPAEAEALTAPILPSERAHDLEHDDIGRSARLDMRKALELAVESRDSVE